jgi:hypothetical protein
MDRDVAPKSADRLSGGPPPTTGVDRDHGGGRVRRDTRTDKQLVLACRVGNASHDKRPKRRTVRVVPELDHAQDPLSGPDEEDDVADRRSTASACHRDGLRGTRSSQLPGKNDNQNVDVSHKPSPSTATPARHVTVPTPFRW